jgi:hypothetical protein
MPHSYLSNLKAIASLRKVTHNKSVISVMEILRLRVAKTLAGLKTAIFVKS